MKKIIFALTLLSSSLSIYADPKTALSIASMIEKFDKSQDTTIIEDAINSDNERIAIVSTDLIRQLDSPKAKDFQKYLNKHSLKFKSALICALADKKIEGIDNICAEGILNNDISYARACLLSLNNYDYSRYLEQIWLGTKQPEYTIKEESIRFIVNSKSDIGKFLSDKIKSEDSTDRIVCVKIISQLHNSDKHISTIVSLATNDTDSKVRDESLLSLAKIANPKQYFELLNDFAENKNVSKAKLLQYILLGKTRFFDDKNFDSKIEQIAQKHPADKAMFDKAISEIKNPKKR